MEDSGDKFASLLIPNCQRSDSQEEKLQSCYLARESTVSPDDVLVQSSSSPDDEPSEQPTGIEMLSLPDSFDDYQTPPEQPYSQNSSSDGHVAATKAAGFDEQGVVDLGKESDGMDTEPMDVGDRVGEIVGGDLVTEGVETEVVSEPEEGADQVFVEMPEQETDDGGESVSEGLETEVVSEPEVGADQVFVEKPHAEQEIDNGGESVTEGLETEVVSELEEGAHQVFVELPHTEEEISNQEECKLPVSMEYGDFKDVLNRDKSGDGGKSVTEGLEKEEVSEPEEGAHQVFEEMPHIKQETEQETDNKEECKLLVSMDKEEQNSDPLEDLDFKVVLHRVLKMVESSGGPGGGGDEDDDVDFIETAKKRGMTFPRPRWYKD